MEFGNVYEVFQIGDMVKIDDVRHCDDGRTGVIIEEGNSRIEDIPYYKVRLDPIVSDLGRDVKGFDAWVYATSLKRRFSENVEIAMGLRSGKTYLTQIGKFTNKDNGFDSVIYEMEKQRKFAERGTDEMKNVEVKKIIFNGFKTIVFWNDGTKTIVSMSQEERNFDPEDAFRAAYTKKMYGTNSKIKRIIKEKSNIEQHQRIVEEKLKESNEKIRQEWDKFVKENCPWLYEDKEEKEKVEAPVSHKFKVGDGVAISSIYSPYFGRGGKIVAITRKRDDGTIRYTVEFYEPGNPGSSVAYDFCECQLTYDPSRAIDEKTKKMADAWYVFFHEMIDADDSSKGKKDGND